MRSCIIVGNGFTVAQWSWPSMVAADIIATNWTWSIKRPDWIMITNGEARRAVPLDLQSRCVTVPGYETSGAAAIVWAAQQPYETIYLMGFDSCTQDGVAVKLINPLNLKHGRRGVLWQKEYREALTVNKALLKVCTLITRDQRQRFQNSFGLTWLDAPAVQEDVSDYLE
jgi:hypothetical protein